jgi:hypothetical protein
MQNRPAGMVLDVACRLSCQLLEKIHTSIPEIYPADVAEPEKLRPDNEIGNAMAIPIPISETGEQNLSSLCITTIQGISKTILDTFNQEYIYVFLIEPNC